MMLKSRYHVVCLGLTPWSLIHAIILREQGKDVLVVDDKGLATESPSLRWLTNLEILTLKEIGAKYQIKALQPLNPYLRRSSLGFTVGKTHWVSGATVKDNLRELMRKFDFFNTPLMQSALSRTEEELDRELAALNREFIGWLRSPPVRGRAVPAFAGSSSPWIAEFHRLSLEENHRAYQGPEISPLTQLLAAHGMAIGESVKHRFGAHELWPLVLRLLSPVWELDRRWLERELVRELGERGGQTKKAGIKSWQIYQQRVEAALLDSYEGVVSHGRLLLYGFPQADGSFQFRFKQRLLQGLQFNWGEQVATPFSDDLSPAIIGMTSSRQLGTNLPGSFLEVEGGNGRLVALVAQPPGSKPDFHSEEAWIFLSRGAQASAPQLPWQQARFKGGWGQWLEDAHDSGDARTAWEHHARRDVDVVDRITQEKLTGVEVWGPLRSKHLGLLGLLTDLSLGEA